MIKNRLFLILALALLGAGCSEQGLLLDYKFAETQKKTKDLGDAKLLFTPRLDILFVVDDSGSMGTHQRNFSAGVHQFTNKIFETQLLDIHIGVTSSLMEPNSPETGMLLGFPNFITNSTPERESLLARNLILGTNGSYEESMFQPLTSALSPGMRKGPNFGFYREDAFLAVVFITDAPDQSQITAEQMYQYLLDLKGGDERKLLGYGAIIPTGEQDCERDSGVPVKIEALMSKLKKGSAENTFSLCSTDYGAKLAELGKNLAENIVFFVPMPDHPVPGTIVVKYGDYIIPEDGEIGWSYVPDRNGIQFSSKLKLDNLPKGQKLSIEYKPAKIYND